MSKITAIGTALPTHVHAQDNICAFAKNIHCNNDIEKRKLQFLYHQSGINTRYSVLPDYSSSVDDRVFYPKTATLEPFPNLEKRMEVYDAHATDLSIQAIENCIAGKLEKKDITHLITVSCTGMSAPGLDLAIIEKMQLPVTIFRTSVNFMGCYAAIHALKLADALCNNAQNANVIIVCTELCTLHFQKENTADNITATLLFADGSSAALIQPSTHATKGILLKSFFSQIAFKGKKDMSWQLSSKGFLMNLSGYIPNLVKEDFNALVQNALQANQLLISDVTHWCIHPGGKKIIEAIEKSTGVATEKFEDSYNILSKYGNMSSATILFVLQKILTNLQTAPTTNTAILFGAAFGPGLTMETFTATYA